MPDSPLDLQFVVLFVVDTDGKSRGMIFVPLHLCSVWANCNKTGSPGGFRTPNLAVNSRPLYR